MIGLLYIENSKQCAILRFVKSLVSLLIRILKYQKQLHFYIPTANR